MLSPREQQNRQHASLLGVAADLHVHRRCLGGERLQERHQLVLRGEILLSGRKGWRRIVHRRIGIARGDFCGLLIDGCGVEAGKDVMQEPRKITATHALRKQRRSDIADLVLSGRTILVAASRSMIVFDAVQACPVAARFKTVHGPQSAENSRVRTCTRRRPPARSPAARYVPNRSSSRRAGGKALASEHTPR